MPKFSLRSVLALLSFFAAGTAAQAACEQIVRNDIEYTVCRFDPQTDDIRIFHSEPGADVFKKFDALERYLWRDRHVLRFAMNGGMFHADMSPVGLFVENGIETSPASTKAGWGNFHLLPNGIFALVGGQAHVMETHAYLQSGMKPDYATQSGPMLVIEGAIHPRFLPDSDSLKRRNGVGIDAQGRAVFVISRQRVRFYDFATLFRDELGCDNALFLDGTISGIYAPELKRNDRLFSMGPIIGVIERAPD